jgi:alkanesulfonate monooxygenase SsuD/methylene tetrahydromethanopterin reductase-like flavin-dependent oxidoreductase (luciferase family)
MANAASLKDAHLGRWPASKRQMGVGVMLPMAEVSAFGPTPPAFKNMLEMTRTAEDAGLDTVWLMDHFFFRPPVADEGTEYGAWEAFTSAAALLQATTKINLGLLVSCLGWRNPGLVAKMTETIDGISGGRFILGVGAGWHKPEYDGFGLPFDHRVSRFEDALAIIVGLLRDGRVSHDGAYFSADDAIIQPRGPLGATGGSPILVGSSGHRMLRLMAQSADAWNAGWIPTVEQLKPKLDAVDEACQEVGRDPKTLIKTTGANVRMKNYTGMRKNPIEGDDQAIADRLAQFRELGCRHFVGGIDECTPKSIEQLGRIAELLG